MCHLARPYPQGNVFPMTSAASPSSRFRRYLKPIVAVLVLALVAYAWQRTRAPPVPPGESWRDQPVPVRVATATHQRLSVQLKALGTVTSLNTVTVRSRVEGELVRLGFQEGQPVEAGALLAEIDPRPFRVQLDQALGTQKQNLAELENARGQLARYRELQSNRFVSAQDLSNQEARVRQLEGQRDSDQAAVDEARLQLEYTRIVAPISGRVGLRAVDVGNLVRANDENGIVTITQTSPISVLFSIPEKDLPAVLDAIQQGRELPVEAWDREERRRLALGRLDSVDNRIDTATGTLRLRALFEGGGEDALFPNQFVNVRLQISDRQALVVPGAAVQFGSQGTFVYVIGGDDTASVRPIRLGASDGERSAVLEGLEEGERVVLEGLDRLREGSQVAVVEDEDGPVEGDGANTGEGAGDDAR